MDKNQDGLVSVKEHIRIVKHKELGGRVWTKIDMENPAELSSWEFYLATRNIFKKVCQE
jgi:hypothetical protein